MIACQLVAMPSLSFPFVPAITAAFLILPGFSQAELPTVLKEDFKRGFAAWETTDPSAWRVREEKKGSSNRLLELYGKSDYKPPHRSPFNMALYRYATVGDFEMTLRLQATKESYGHRDLCLFFGYQDPAHFYYVHLGQKMDDHANQIFIVNDAPRIKISEKTTSGTPWEDGAFHEVKLVREVESGLIEVYFDDMETPVMTAHDKTFDWGRIGVGSFDDTGLFDDVVLKGVEVKPKGENAPADPKTLEYSKWTPEFEIHNAIALSFDDEGRAYVTGARRRKAADLAISERKEWMVDDLGLTDVEEKRALIKRRLSVEKGKTEEAKKLVKDFNGDGSHDWHDLKELSDTVYLVEDTDNDGKADKLSPYASDINTEVTGSMAGVMYHEGDVYVTASPDLLKMRDTDGDDVADEKESIAHGFGVHVAYAGHYMHGLNVGPDGRIYWSIGDKGINVTSKEGVDFRYPHEGIMMRCEPDGSNFEVFARGQRNLQEPRFDKYGNWFGVDNDGDAPGEMERLMYIVQHMDAGWRIGWQYFKNDYNFWTTEGLFKPWFEGQAGHILPPLENYVNGPSGFAWNPGTALSPEYENYFFITQFSSGFQNAFQLEQVGAKFRMVNDHVIGNGVPLVGLNWGPDGGLYGTDWGGGYPLNDLGGVWKIDVPEYADSQARKDTAKLIREGMKDRSPKALGKLLGNADQRIRLKAQFALVARGQRELLQNTALDHDASQMSRIHALWGWAQLKRRKDERFVDALLPLAKDSDAEIRAQFARTIGDMGALSGDGGIKQLAEMLKDESPRVQMLAAISLGNLKVESAIPALIEFAGKIKPSEAYLRHGAIVGLVGCASGEELAALASEKNDRIRRAAVIALRRQGDARIADFLDDSDPFIATDAARGIHDEETALAAGATIEQALPALATALLTTKHSEEALLRRAINANFRIADADSAGRLAEFAASDSNATILRLDALDALSHWTESLRIDRIEGNYRERGAANAKEAAPEIAVHLDSLLSDKDAKVREAALKMTSALDMEVDPAALLSVVSDESTAVDLRIASLRSLAAQEAPQLREAIDGSFAAKDASLRSEALLQLAELDADAAEERAGKILTKVQDITEAQTALSVLANLGQASCDEKLLAWTKKLAAGEVREALQLDVIEAAQARAEASAAINAELAAFEKTRDPSDLAASFAECLEGGDADVGREIFMTHIAAQCVRCHRYSNDPGSSIGPNLKTIAKEKDRAYLLQSIIAPQDVIATGYGTIALTLKNGDTVSGLFRKETKESVEIRDAENQTIHVPVADIASRTPVISTMPPMNALLKKREIRDLVEYLTTLR